MNAMRVCLELAIVRHAQHNWYELEKKAEKEGEKKCEKKQKSFEAWMTMFFRHRQVQRTKSYGEEVMGSSDFLSIFCGALTCERPAK